MKLNLFKLIEQVLPNFLDDEHLDDNIYIYNIYKNI